MTKFEERMNQLSKSGLKADPSNKQFTFAHPPTKTFIFVDWIDIECMTKEEFKQLIDKCKELVEATK